MVAMMSLASQVLRIDNNNRVIVHLLIEMMYFCLIVQVVFDQWSSPFVVGSLIGSSLMFAQMQFVLMIVYFVFADHAKNNEHGEF